VLRWMCKSLAAALERWREHVSSLKRVRHLKKKCLKRMSNLVAGAAFVAWVSRVKDQACILKSTLYNDFLL
jgi:hypothetical protein